MSAIALNIPKPLRPWMVWTMAGVLTLVTSIAVLTPNLLRARIQADQAAATVQLQANASLDKQSVAEIEAAFVRKIVRTSSLELTVLRPDQAVEQIRLLAERLGGYLENAQAGGQDVPYANVAIRVPSARLEEAKAEIRKLAIAVDSEKTEASDVSKQYVDMQARLRNLRAQEAQYLQIMKSAVKVPDMLEVSAKLSEVRGEIEQQQAEFETLSRQVEMAAISVVLHRQVDAQVLGIHWRPLYQMKLAARDGLNALADYVSAMLSVIFVLPAILLWVGTILFGVVLTWRILRWAWKLFVVSPKASVIEKVAN